MSHVEISVPIHTVSEANRREHWAKKARRTKSHRIACAFSVRTMASAKQLEAMLAAGIEVTLTRVAPRELDDDNLRGALKGCRDGVTDGLALSNDRDPRIRWAYAQERGAVREYAVRIRIEVWK